MLTVQHSLVTLLAVDGNIEYFKRLIPYVLLPDAIRMYTGNRECSHFELNSDGSDTSWIEFPTDLKNVNKDNIKMHLADNIIKCAIGEKSHTAEFNRRSEHLKPTYMIGIKMHLWQDKKYDEFIRKYIDCSDKYNGNFYFKGKKYDSTSVRELITNIENDGVAILAKLVYDLYGLEADQRFFDATVKPQLYRVYKKELADNTYKYMKVREDICQAISSKQWNKIKYTSNIDVSEYNNMYKSIIHTCRNHYNNLKYVTYRCISRGRDNNGNIIKYKIANDFNDVTIMTASELKFKIKTNKLECKNLKLTSDNKLITFREVI